jgi:predicted SpoU family rRNA methylase
MLKKCPRKKVFVPDKKSDSIAVVNEFKKHGWYVSIPDFGSSVKDVDDAIRKFGKLYVLSEVVGKIYPARDAEVYMSLNGFLINS